MFQQSLLWITDTVAMNMYKLTFTIQRHDVEISKLMNPARFMSFWRWETQYDMKRKLNLKGSLLSIILISFGSASLLFSRSIQERNHPSHPFRPVYGRYGEETFTRTIIPLVASMTLKTVLCMEKVAEFVYFKLCPVGVSFWAFSAMKRERESRFIHMNIPFHHTLPFIFFIDQIRPPLPLVCLIIISINQSKSQRALQDPLSLRVI